MAKRASWRLIVLGALGLLATACLLAGAPAKRPGAEIPFRHVIIDKDAVGANGQGMDCKGAGDIDGDGFPDVVIGSKELAWYAYPHWTKHVIAIAQQEFTTDMQVADVDGDGDLDIVIPDGEKGMVCWFENPRPKGNPAQGHWVRHLIGYQGDWAHDVEVGDINGDGKLDVLTRKDSTLLWLQNSPDSWRRVEIAAAMSKGEGTALADINGDGRPDIVQNGYWLECPRDPATQAWQKHTIATGWPRQLGVSVADLNEDGRPDVLLAPAEEHGRLSWYQAPADPLRGAWAEHVIDGDVDFIHTFKVADMNNDGRLDVVTAEMPQSGYHPEIKSRGRVGVYFNLLEGGRMKWVQQVVATTGSHNLRVEDIGSDGDMDIIGANWGGPHHPVEMWENELIDRSKLSFDAD